MSQGKPKASFITFYSFKGGVGRSMALINTAGILAGRGFRVLVMDLDLEAPGLSYLKPDAPTSPSEQGPARHPLQLGFVDLLSDAKARGLEADLFALSAGDLAKRYTQAYKLPEGLGEFNDGSLHIMPAGKFDSSYAQRFDALNLRELYQQGLGEPLIRAFKKKLAEADLYDYVLVDSRTGFSDEAGICTRDLADYLMILSGLNRQNVEGTCEFLKALRLATEGKEARFQIILSPVPNGEDALVDERENVAKTSFEEAWGSEIDLSLQIPYHPQLALTEEPHIFRRRRGYLFQAYRAIERRMLRALGHDARSLMRTVEEKLQQKDYPAVLRDLRHMVRLDGGRSTLVELTSKLSTDDEPSVPGKPGGKLTEEKATLDKILSDQAGRHVVEFVVDNLPLEERDWRTRILRARLTELAPDLADRLYQRMVRAAPTDAEELCSYAVFLDSERGDKDGAEAYLKRAIEAAPRDADTLTHYAFFLMDVRGDKDGAEAYFKRAIEAAPGDAGTLTGYAFFLMRGRGDKDGAEAYFKRAIEAAPRDVRSLDVYAVFLERERGDKDAAEAYFKRAIEVAPDFVSPLANYGQFLVGLARLSDGEKVLLSAFERIRSGRRWRDLAEVCFSLWLVSRMQGNNAEGWERRYKFLLQQKFGRVWWSFDLMLQQAETTLPKEEFEYAKALALAFLDESKVADLEQYERWRTLEPLDPRLSAVHGTN